MKVVLVHGWAFGPWMWHRMNLRLTDLMVGAQLEFTCADLGFFGEPLLPSGKFDLAIGHSFGLQWLLENDGVKFDRLISVNGFTRFGATEDFQCGWPHRIIKRMRKGLGSDVQKVLTDFFENSGVTDDGKMDEGKKTEKTAGPGRPEFSNADIERLDWALEALINGDGREQWSEFEGPRRVIAATADQIVSTEHSHQCFPDGDIQWLKSDCHCLPLKFPEICAALVRELIEVS